MRWRRGERSVHLEDRRAQTGGHRFPGGASIGCGGLLILLVLSVLFRQDFFALLDLGMGGTVSVGEDVPFEPSPEEEQLVDFTSFVLDDIHETWTSILPGQYQAARLVLFRDAIQSACGLAESASGPFYCPADQKVYLEFL